MSHKPRAALPITVLFALIVLLAACGSPTAIPPTAQPPTAAPAQGDTSPDDQAGATAELPTTEPPTAEPPTAEPPTAEPPTAVPPTAVPPTAIPPTAVPPTAVPPTPAPVVSPFFDNQVDAVSVLASYINAVNRREFDRAWAYWQTPPSSSYADFVAGFAGTASALLAVHPPTWSEGAMGSSYAQVPTLLQVLHTDGTLHNYVGCYVARTSHVEGAEPGWWLYSADVSAAPGNSDDVRQLTSACGPSPYATEPDYDDRGGPVQVLASLFNAVTLREYTRAWDYWETPPNPTLADFEAGYANTDSIFLVVRPPEVYEGAAGSTFAQVPSLMLAVHTDSTNHYYSGCYVGRSPNLGPDAGIWSLYSATAQVLPSGAVGAHLLTTACGD